MVITVTCPSCSASFPVDPAKIPAGGVKARCSACGYIFRIEKPAEDPPVAATTAAPPAPAPPADPFARAAPFETAAAPSGGVQGFTFGKRDPTDKARRLARVLVSDMVMYNAERHQTALASGTLVQAFDEEIEKSWKEFVDQVGEELANGQGRQFWKDALNDILAKGNEVF